MSENDPRAEELERELEDMEERSEELDDEIDEAREDWERKKADPQVPGAAGDPESAQSDDQPEADYPTKD
jgi:predicted  nucleic acid-binding Zn-ribbon protein